MNRHLNTITIPSATRFLSDVRRFVEQQALEAGFPDDTVEQFKLAVDEACTNVIKHAYKGEENGTIDISISVSPARFTVTIRDEGIAFNPGLYAVPDLRRSIEKRRPGGLGIHIMRRVMDRVEYKTRGKVNEVRLIKFRNGNAKTTQRKAEQVQEGK